MRLTVLPAPRAKRIRIVGRTLVVELRDGRSLCVPLDWYPRLVHSTKAERSRWRLTAKGAAMRWPALDQDISVENLLFGLRSTESTTAFQKWLKTRTRRAATSRSRRSRALKR